LKKNPFNKCKDIELDDLIDFILYDENNEAKISENLFVRKFPKSFEVH
jgi:hypothetical protein